MSETCRVIINQVKQKLHLVGYLLIRYFKDARYHEHKKKTYTVCVTMLAQSLYGLGYRLNTGESGFGFWRGRKFFSSLVSVLSTWSAQHSVQGRQFLLASGKLVGI